MIKINEDIVEAAIVKAVEDLNENLGIGASVSAGLCPGTSGFFSIALLDLYPTIADSLGIVIPVNKYIFQEEKTRRQLTIKEATQKLIQVAKYAK